MKGKCNLTFVHLDARLYQRVPISQMNAKQAIKYVHPPVPLFDKIYLLLFSLFINTPESRRTRYDNAQP